ncbi:Superoxide dismutase-like protein YojM precursor [Pseudovibrio axinellae]|uniref:Superoxide dismutase [Cu-Zn] n=1 Tax=Pseudovibrio axinellae TaxID=989403 RepID=A0A161VC34_9HYPH|nr:superoxide dismutase family protein [Pseudovibrio axinellae]KZL21715.1 Superoxide dismutase-like protein YojM precursor [Pseudovibrio axinellae]SEQ20658.1 superoxide dismutase, Cu-Zn family [Pseudovibrio axinellae]
MKLSGCAAIVVAGLVVVSGAGAAAESERVPGGPTAVAIMKDVDGKAVGKVVLNETPSGILHITAMFDGLPPGEHGFHVHENGLCEPTFAAAGGHFAPEGHDHGIDVKNGAHAGDLPNLHVPLNGKLILEVFSKTLHLAPDDKNSLIGGSGRALVIHENADDYHSQPSGDAGGRIACGVIVPVTQNADGFQSYPEEMPSDRK